MASLRFLLHRNNVKDRIDARIGSEARDGAGVGKEESEKLSNRRSRRGNGRVVTD